MAASPEKSVRVSLLQASGWLALFLIAAKAVTWDKPWWPHLPARLLGLLMSSWTDVLFALVCGTIAQLFLQATRRWPYVSAFLRSTFLFFFAFCALYGMAAVGLFRYFNRPITFELLGLIGNAGVVRSSIVARITPAIGLAMVLVPIAYLILVAWQGRSRPVSRWLVGFAMVWILTGGILQRQFWAEQQLVHLWLSPHYEFIRTAALRLSGGQRPSFPKNFPPEDLEEFRTIGARGLTNDSHFQPEHAVPPPKNVVLVVLESVGTKYLRPYGSPLAVTPVLEREAEHALLFENIYAHASFTYCSFRTLNFSVYPGLPWHYSLLPDARKAPAPLAETLRARGARTAYINNGNLYWEDQHWLLTQSKAFDRLFDYETVGCPTLSSWGTEDRCAFERLIQWIDEKPNESFFAILWTDQTHDPYPLSRGQTAIDFFAGQTPPPLAKDLNAYLNVLHETDRQLGIMFDALRARGLADDTLVVLTGDHGEAFADPHDQRGHAWSVFEEEVHVPLLFWNPRLFPHGGRVPAVGGHVDVNPTIADLLGLAPNPEWQGRSLFDPDRPNRAFFLAIAGGDVFGVRDENWKYIYDVTTARESLFDLALDPTEQRDLAKTEPERARRLRQRVAAWISFEDAFLWGREN